MILPLLAACSTATQPVEITPEQTAVLTLYATATQTATPTPPNPATATPQPTPTATPITHTVKTGETLGTIAYRYGISVADLKAANPGVDPYLLVTGTVLIIPSSATLPTTAPTATSAAPTPVAVQLDKPVCSTGSDGGMWCFILARNSQDSAVENVTAAVHLLDQDGKTLAEGQASAVLNLIPAGQAFPLAVFFKAPLPDFDHIDVSLQNALPVNSDDARYVTVTINDQRVEIISGGLAAEISGELIPPEEGSASQVWIAAAAYSADGQPVGVRRWESQTGLAADGRQAFSMRVYSTGAVIARVEVWVEARP